MTEIRVSTAILITSLVLLAPLHALAQEPGDDWRFSIGTYLWFPSVSGDLNYGPPPKGGGSPGVSIDSGSTLGDFSFSGQVAASGETSSGDSFRFTPVAEPSSVAAGCCPCSTIFEDGFESGDTTAWSNSVGSMAAPVGGEA